MSTGSLTLGYAGCCVRVEATDPTALVWLREFLGPDFDECPDDMPAHVVALRTDAAIFDALQRRGPDPAARSMDVFALDGGMVSLPLWQAEGDEVLVRDSERRTFYQRDAGRARTEIISQPGNPAIRTALLRVVREIATAHVVESGGLVVHGAALAWQGKGYVIAGPKEAGKTTLLLHLLWNSGAAYVANDRTAIWPDREPVTLRGMPTIVSVRSSTLARLPALRETFQSSPFHHRHSVEEAEVRGRASSAREAPSSDLSPAQLVRLLGVGRCAELPLAALIFPKRTGLPGGATLEQIASDATLRELLGARFAGQSTRLVGELFVDSCSDQRVIRRDAACAALSTRLPAFECFLGGDAYTDPASAGRILSAVAQATASRTS